MSNAQVTVLVENTAGGRGLLGVHGLAFWIRHDGKRVLFDTGQGRALLANAAKLGARLELADAVVLSHGHYDHTGGLGQVLRTVRRPTLYAHPAAFEPKYAPNADGSARDVGMPFLDAQHVTERAELIRVEAPTDVAAGLKLTGPIPRETDFEDTGGDFFLDADCTRPDPLTDDQAAYIETPGGTVVILGCAHAGVINTLRYIRRLTHGRPIHTVLGGMHLLHADEARMPRTLAALRELDVHRLLPCHCTGPDATARLWKEFPARCAAAPAGSRLEIEK